MASASPIRAAFGQYTVNCVPGLPPLYDQDCERAKLVDEFGLKEQDGDVCCFSVARGMNWPFLVVAQRFSPGPEAGFYPGVLLIPETQRLFIGAGERLLAYDLTEPKRLWEDQADTGFCGWARHGDFVVMSAELELAAWTLDGTKLSSSFVEPPWSYEMDGEMVHLDVMGEKCSFSIEHGRPGPS